MDIFINITLFSIIISILLYMLSRIMNKNTIIRISLALYLLSFVIFFVGCLYYSFNVKRIPLANQFESVMVMIFLVFITSLLLYLRKNNDYRLIYLSSVVLSIMISLLNIIEPSMRPLLPALRSNWLFFHVITSIWAYSFFTIATAFSIYGVFKSFNRDLIIRIVKFGFFMLTMGIITGSIWAENAWGRYWSWDPKETWSLITWFYYATFLHLSKKNIDDKKLSFLLIIGLLVVIFTYFGVNYLMSGLHSYV